MINLYQLNIFVTVVDEGTFSAAAKKLHMTQPAVSLQIKGLEERYQTRLFERQGQRLVPTERAQGLIEPARELLAVAARTERAIAVPEEMELRGRLTLAVAAGGRELPLLLAAFRRQHPAVRVSANRKSEAEALAALRAGNTDFALLSDMPANKQFESQPLAADALVLVASASHEWVTNPPSKPLAIAALAAQPLILPQMGSDLRLTIEAALEEWGLERSELQPALELDAAEDVAMAVAAGAGLGFVPRGLVSPSVAAVAATFGDDDVVLVIPQAAYLVRQRRASHSAIANAFWQQVAAL